MSDAVDSTISKIDFRPLTGQKIFLDTSFVLAAGKAVPGVPTPTNLVTSDYVISGLRQQMVAAGCLLVDKREDADIVCEARCGALGTDGHSVIYGIPASNGIGGVGTIISGTPAIPAIPEISVAKKELKSAASKVAVFAYTRETREPVWQSGIAQAGSNARDTWFLGVGPWQYGSIYSGTRFAGKRIKGTTNQSINSTYAQEQVNGVNHREGFLFNQSPSSAAPMFAQPSPPPGTNQTIPSQPPTPPQTAQSPAQNPNYYQR